MRISRCFFPRLTTRRPRTPICTLVSLLLSLSSLVASVRHDSVFVFREVEMMMLCPSNASAHARPLARLPASATILRPTVVRPHQPIRDVPSKAEPTTAWVAAFEQSPSPREAGAACAGPGSKCQPRREPRKSRWPLDGRRNAAPRGGWIAAPLCSASSRSEAPPPPSSLVGPLRIAGAQQ